MDISIIGYGAFLGLALKLLKGRGGGEIDNDGGVVWVGVGGLSKDAGPVSHGHHAD